MRKQVGGKLAEEISINRINQASRQQPIKLQNGRNSRESGKRQCSEIVQERKMSQSPSIKQLNEKLLPANYCADKLIRRMIRLLKKYNKTGVTRHSHSIMAGFLKWTTNLLFCRPRGL